MFPTLPPITHDTVTPVEPTVVVGTPLPDVADLTMGVFDLSDTGLVSEDPAVLIWCAAVSEHGLVW